MGDGSTDVPAVRGSSQSFLHFINTLRMSHPALTLSMGKVVWLSWNVLLLAAYSGFCEQFTDVTFFFFFFWFCRQ